MTELLAIEERNGVLRLRFAALPDETNVALALEQARAAVPASGGAVEFDLEGVDRRDLCALAAVSELLRECRQRGVVFAAVNLPEGVTDADLEPVDPGGSRDARAAVAYQAVADVGEQTRGFVRELGAVIEFAGVLTRAIAAALRHPRRVRWTDVLLYMDRCGTDALFIVLLICFLMGLILGFQAALQMHAFGADIYVADLVGLSICKELGPLMVAMICTGRAGSAFAAEIGTMKVSEEVDALVTMGLDPGRFLVVPKVLALMLVMPVLTLFGDVAGVAGGFVVGTLQLGLPFVAYWNETVLAIAPWDIGEGLVKSAVFAFLIGAVGCQRGLRTEGGAQQVGTSTTSAVVSGILLVIVADAALTVLFTRLTAGP